jgi:hypothetical protein
MVSLILAAFDENDKYISGLDKSIEFRLLENSYASLRDSGLTSRVELKLPMGRYKIKAVVYIRGDSNQADNTVEAEIKVVEKAGGGTTIGGQNPLSLAPGAGRIERLSACQHHSSTALTHGARRKQRSRWVY